MTDDVSQAFVQALVDARVAESITAEFKQVMPGGTDTDKREFLADVTSFANTVGGVLYFGVSEENGVAEGLPGIATDALDVELLRLENLLRDSVKPRMVGVRMKAIPVGEHRSIIAVSVPRSLLSPHMVVFGGGSRFYGRNSRGKYQLDVDELRTAFLASTSAEERVARFRAERLIQIQAGETPLPLDDKAKLVLHVLPLLQPAGGESLDPRAVVQLKPPIRPMWSDGHDYRFNLNGIVVHGPTHEGSTHSYLQVFRNGSLESVCTAVLRPEERGNFIRSLTIEPLLFDTTRDYLQAQEALGISGPRAVMVSLLGVRGYRVLPKTANRHWDSFRLPLPQDDLVLPEILVTERAPDTRKLLRPLCDMIWQAAGWDSCRNYDDAGEWRGD
jgi:hypothetical protein